MTKKTLAIIAAIAAREQAADEAIRQHNRETNAIMQKIPFRSK